MRKHDFIIEMVIKENKGRFTPKIDFFRGNPEEAIELLQLKYSREKHVLVRLGKGVEQGIKELDKVLK